LTDREIEVPLGEGRNGERATLGGQHLHIEAVTREDALRDAGPQGRRLGDGQGRDANLAQPRTVGGTGRRLIGVCASTQADHHGGDQRKSKNLLHRRPF
jgi:hypothetical protein